MFIINSFSEIGLQSRPTCKTPCQKWIDSCQCWLERCQGIHQPTSWKRNQGEIFFFKCRLRIFYFRLIKKSQSGISWNLTKLSKNRWDWYLFIEVFKKVKNQLLVLKDNEPNFVGYYKLCIWLLHELFSFCYKLSIWNLVHIFLKSWDSSPFKLWSACILLPEMKLSEKYAIRPCLNEL